ncbi:MAG TPA: diacylglycerol kinase family protein [Burkholderiales bacterium]|nr:diacylglycerol kinase family protein [Burkholderiales bacterium]
MRVTLIHNPAAGREGAGDARKLEKLLRRFGHDVRYHSSKDKGLRRILKKRADLVAVAGGDGTVGKVTRRMVSRDVPLAVLPSGTANNVARSLGLVDRPFEELVRGWDQARRVKLDVGIAAGPWGERYFVEGVGAGLFADLLTRQGSDQDQRRKKRRGNPVERALKRLKEAAESCEPVDIRARLDGEDISGSYLLLEAVNLRYVGPNLHLAHDSQPGDGQFDVIMATEAERSRLVHYLEHWQENRERLAMLPSRRGKRLQIEWTGFPLHIDDRLEPKEDAEPDEMAGLVEARIAHAVEFLVPAPSR